MCTIRKRQNEIKLNLKDPTSWAFKQQHEIVDNRQGLAQLRAVLGQLDAANKQVHTRLAQISEQAIAKLNADSEFLNHVQEIIRFVKSA